MIIFNELNLKKRIELPIAMTIGSFDGIHSGHKYLLDCFINESNKRGLKKLLMTFDFDEHKHREVSKFLTTKREKQYIISKLGIDYLWFLPFNEYILNMSYEDFFNNIILKNLNLKLYFCGKDHTVGANKKGNTFFLKKFAQRHGFELHDISLKKDNKIKVSSSIIRDLILKDNLQQANKLLGHYYFLVGSVVKGDGIGRELGFPTANLDYFDWKILPGNGVYFGTIKVEDKLFKCLIYIGTRPTLSGDNHRVEVHILDFNKHIYDKEVVVYFVKKLREDRKFSGPAALRRQIEDDIKACVNEQFSETFCI